MTYTRELREFAVGRAKETASYRVWLWQAKGKKKGHGIPVPPADSLGDVGDLATTVDDNWPIWMRKPDGWVAVRRKELNGGRPLCKHPEYPSMTLWRIPGHEPQLLWHSHGGMKNKLSIGAITLPPSDGDDSDPGVESDQVDELDLSDATEAASRKASRSKTQSSKPVSASVSKGKAIRTAPSVAESEPEQAGPRKGPSGRAPTSRPDTPQTGKGKARQGVTSQADRDELATAPAPPVVVKGRGGKAVSTATAKGKTSQPSTPVAAKGKARKAATPVVVPDEEDALPSPTRDGPGSGAKRRLRSASGPTAPPVPIKAPGKTTQPAPRTASIVSPAPVSRGPPRARPLGTTAVTGPATRSRARIYSFAANAAGPDVGSTVSDTASMDAPVGDKGKKRQRAPSSSEGGDIESEDAAEEEEDESRPRRKVHTQIALKKPRLAGPRAGREKPAHDERTGSQTTYTSTDPEEIVEVGEAQDDHQSESSDHPASARSGTPTSSRARSVSVASSTGSHGAPLSKLGSRARAQAMARGRDWLVDFFDAWCLCASTQTYGGRLGFALLKAALNRPEDIPPMETFARELFYDGSTGRRPTFASVMTDLLATTEEVAAITTDSLEVMKISREEAIVSMLYHNRGYDEKCPLRMSCATEIMATPRGMGSLDMTVSAEGIWRGEGPTLSDISPAGHCYGFRAWAEFLGQANVPVDMPHADGSYQLWFMAPPTDYNIRLLADTGNEPNASLKQSEKRMLKLEKLRYVLLKGRDLPAFIIPPGWHTTVMTVRLTAVTGYRVLSRSFSDDAQVTIRMAIDRINEAPAGFPRGHLVTPIRLDLSSWQRWAQEHGVEGIEWATELQDTLEKVSRQLGLPQSTAGTLTFPLPIGEDRVEPAVELGEDGTMNIDPSDFAQEEVDVEMDGTVREDDHRTPSNLADGENAVGTSGSAPVGEGATSLTAIEAIDDEMTENPVPQAVDLESRPLLDALPGEDNTGAPLRIEAGPPIAIMQDANPTVLVPSSSQQEVPVEQESLQAPFSPVPAMSSEVQAPPAAEAEADATADAVPADSDMTM